LENTVNTDLIRDHVDSFILRFLASGDSYGYDIHKAISNATEGVYEIKQPTLYSCLKRLEKNGFITSYDGQTSNGAQRKYYSITDKGREFLNIDIVQWEFSRTLLDRLLSDKQIDLASVEHPFDPSELRPRTRRGTGVAAAATTDGATEDVDVMPDADGDPIAPSEADSQQQIGEAQPAVLQQTDPTQTAPEPPAPDPQSSVAADDASVEPNQAVESAPADALSYDSTLQATQLDIDSYIEDRDNAPKEKPILADFLRDHLENNADDYLTPLNELFREEPYLNEQRPPVYQEEVPEEQHARQNAYNYGELKERAQSEGYRLLPYSKAVSTSYYSMNFIFSARLRRDSLVLLYLVMLAEVLISYFALDRFAGLGYVFYLVVGCVLLLCPIAGVILYLIKPDKRIRAEFDLKSSISGMIMLTINLFIVSMLFAFFLFKADLGRPATMIKPILYPTFLFIDLPIYTLIYAALYNTRRYHLK